MARRILYNETSRAAFRRKTGCFFDERGDGGIHDGDKRGFCKNHHRAGRRRREHQLRNELHDPSAHQRPGRRRRAGRGSAAAAGGAGGQPSYEKLPGDRAWPRQGPAVLPTAAGYGTRRRRTEDGAFAAGTGKRRCGREKAFETPVPGFRTHFRAADPRYLRRGHLRGTCRASVSARARIQGQPDPEHSLQSAHRGQRSGDDLPHRMGRLPGGGGLWRHADPRRADGNVYGAG